MLNCCICYRHLIFKLNNSKLALKTLLLLTLLCQLVISAKAQAPLTTSGIVFENKTQQRLANIKIVNKKTYASTISSDIGEFRINANPGDTLSFSDNLHETKDVVVDTNPAIIVSLNKINQLSEVTITENSLGKDLKETQKVYRSKGVFYTGKPHYYYLFLKPMTFIYENFKSEVIQARKFNRLAKLDLDGQEISRRFNERTVQSVIPLDDDKAEDFVIKYWPTIQQMRQWNDYDVIQYIKRSYEDYLKQMN